MITIATVISSEIIQSLKQRAVKVFRFGKDDVQTAKQGVPAGIDSSPIKDMIAIFAETGIKGKTTIVGYLSKDQLAEPGEIRMYSQDSQGQVKNYIWTKIDGTIHFGGDQDNLLKYAPLAQVLAQYNTDILIELGKIAAGIATGGGSYTPGSLSLDISSAKATELKTKSNTH